MEEVDVLLVQGSLEEIVQDSGQNDLADGSGSTQTLQMARVKLSLIILHYPTI